MGSTASMTHWLGTQVRLNCQWCSLAKWGYQLISAGGQSQWLGFLLDCCCRQEIWSTKKWVLVSVNPSQLSIPTWLPVAWTYRFPQWPPWSETQVDLWETSFKSGKTGHSPLALLSHQTNCRPRVHSRCSVSLGEGWWGQSETAPLTL